VGGGVAQGRGGGGSPWGALGKKNRFHQRGPPSGVFTRRRDSGVGLGGAKQELVSVGGRSGVGRGRGVRGQEGKRGRVGGMES